MYFAASAAAWALEICAVGWDGSSLRRILAAPRRSDFVNLFLLLVNALGFSRIWLLWASLGLWWLSNHAAGLVSWSFHMRTGSFLADAAVFYAAWTFAHYWSHRLWHTRLFWPLHRFHHSAQHMSPLLESRDHPIQLALEVLFEIGPVIVLGPSPAVVAAVIWLNVIYQAVIHAELPWSWGWFGRWVLISPLGHRLHHSIAPEHRDRNFGNLVLWDRIFGTYAGTAAGLIPVGVTN